MAKMRMVRPETWTDEKFVSLDPMARLLFIGMWNFACDNGHLDDSALQLKMRVLPGDSVDIEPLLDSLVAAGMVKRGDGWIKVVNLSEKQPLDMRFLVFCEHCAHDEYAHYDQSDKKETRRSPRGGTKSAPSAHDVHTKGARRSGDGDGDGDGDGRGAVAPDPRKRGTRIPDGFAVTNDMRTWAKGKNLDHLDLDGITEEFVDYWRGVPGSKGVKLDWTGTWRNWIRRKGDDAKVRTIAPRTDPLANVPSLDELEARRGF